MQPYRLRPNIRHCEIGSRSVCLDLNSSRYFLLEGVLATHLAAFRAGTASHEAISDLRKLNLIEPGPAETAHSVAPTPSTSLFDDRMPGPSPWLLCTCIVEQVRVRRRLARRSLGALLAPTRLQTAEIESYKALAAAFARGSRYRSATDQCLVRCLAMRAMFARRGLGVDLVIGVTLPFAAHCWVQNGSVLLSDPLDRVRNFKPLLTVR